MCKELVVVVILFVMVISVTGCGRMFDSEYRVTEKQKIFADGISDGLFIGLRLIVSIFKDVDIYANNHTKGYPIGFWIGITMIALAAIGDILYHLSR